MSTHRGVVRIDSLAALKVNVGILRHAAHDRPVGIEGPAPVCEHLLVVHHGSQVVVRGQLDLGDFVRPPA